MKRALVTGAAGFIGHHMVMFLQKKGYFVRGVDYKKPEHFPKGFEMEEYFHLDLREPSEAESAFEGPPFDEVYHFAADMGGIGFITHDFAKLTRNSAKINTSMIEAARLHDAGRFLFSSSACVYRQDRQSSVDAAPLKESDAWPADPEPGYGLEKLFMEKLCEYFAATYKMQVRVARFHNVYGPEGTYDGGREKSPAAVCRKVAMAEDGGDVDIWGDGEQTRSFLYIDDCCDGVYRLMQSDFDKPINIGSDRCVSINQLVTIVANIAKKDLHIVHVDGPQGVRGRNSDNALMREVLDWEPGVSLEDGLNRTYEWILSEVKKRGMMTLKRA